MQSSALLTRHVVNFPSTTIHVLMAFSLINSFLFRDQNTSFLLHAPHTWIAMESITHKVDPNGDTLLTLRNPNAPFGGDAAVWANALTEHRPEKLRRNERELKLLAQAKQSTPNSPQEIQFQLSSKHLTRESGYFQGLMANNWKEASASRDFVYSVTAEDWGEAALLMVMKIIHSQTSEIPQVIDSEMVAKIAVIVDYYQCRKVVDSYAKTWVQNMNSKELNSCGYGRKLLLRLFVSHYFSSDVDFNRCTQIVIRESRGPIHSLGLPFPQNIIGELCPSCKKLSQPVG